MFRLAAAVEDGKEAVKEQHVAAACGGEADLEAVLSCVEEADVLVWSPVNDAPDQKHIPGTHMLQDLLGVWGECNDLQPMDTSRSPEWIAVIDRLLLFTLDARVVTRTRRCLYLSRA